MLAIKRLTTNDISWFSPKSKSHQSGINLPLKSFKEMFQDVYNDASSNAPRLDITANWFASDGTLIDTSKSQVIKYHSKNELRLVTVPIQSVSHHVDLGATCLFVDLVQPSTSQFFQKTVNTLFGNWGTKCCSKNCLQSQLRLFIEILHNNLANR